MKNNTKT